MQRAVYRQLRDMRRLEADEPLLVGLVRIPWLVWFRLSRRCVRTRSQHLGREFGTEFGFNADDGEEADRACPPCPRLKLGF